MITKNDMKFATRYALVPFNEYERLRVRPTAPIVDNPLKRPELARTKQTRKELDEEASSPSLSYDEITDMSQKLERYLSDLRKLRQGTRDLSLSNQSPISSSSPLRRKRKNVDETESFLYENENTEKKRRAESDDDNDEKRNMKSEEWNLRSYHDRESDRDEKEEDDDESETDKGNFFYIEKSPSIQSSRKPTPQSLIKKKESVMRLLNAKGFVTSEGAVEDGKTKFTGSVLDNLLSDVVSDSTNSTRSSKTALNKFGKTLKKANIETDRFPPVSSPVTTRSQKTGKKDIKGSVKENPMEKKWIEAKK